MDRPTKQRLSMIASIQVDAINSLLENPNTDWDLAKIYLQVTNDDIHTAAGNLLDVYKQMQEIPSIVRTLSEYQLLVCTLILFRMEETWLLDNSQGVYGAWAEIHKAMDKFHPELTLTRV